jgi:hypothetical protein
MDNNKMIRLIFTASILWIAVAFTWDPFVAAVEKTQAVDKTKEIVYNVINKVKEKTNNVES